MAQLNHLNNKLYYPQDNVIHYKGWFSLMDWWWVHDEIFTRWLSPL